MEKSLCPMCGATMSEEFRLCPSCEEQLKQEETEIERSFVAAEFCKSIYQYDVAHVILGGLLMRVLNFKFCLVGAMDLDDPTPGHELLLVTFGSGDLFSSVIPMNLVSENWESVYGPDPQKIDSSCPDGMRDSYKWGIPDNLTPPSKDELEEIIKESLVSLRGNDKVTPLKAFLFWNEEEEGRMPLLEGTERASGYNIETEASMLAEMVWVAKEKFAT